MNTPKNNIDPTTAIPTTPILPNFIKPGAFVRLRDGSKAEIYRTDKPMYGLFAVHGAIDSPAGWQMCNWNGVKSTIYKDPDPWDIIGPWIDRPDASKLWPLLPPWIKWLAMDDTGQWFGFMNKPTVSINNGIWTAGSSGYASFIPPEHNPIFPNGDWIDSLIERPE